MAGSPPRTAAHLRDSYSRKHVMLDWTTCEVVERHPGRVSGAWVFGTNGWTQLRRFKEPILEVVDSSLRLLGGAPATRLFSGRACSILA